ncbi:NUDIX domain-containing protein [Pelagibacterium lentulum]|uniref:GDP-mannose pyrophosphatase n=1 Tax=Pelagibacterium lentulum TaxID=2029865 RepID=A0A916R8E8_9HYPH|nr:NUDIX domain-containing protein [Pelagibacterium lentulum]GGA35966.1 hypothetical protein GCM10011499_01640 [Pelagibacterium lentulum]
MSDSIHPISKKILAENWGSLSAHEFEYRTRNGPSQILVREVYDHGSAAAVLLVNPDAGKITLVRQFRLPPHLNGDDGFLLETCAGLLDGDSPEVCAKKEAMEETGIAPQTLLHAFDLYASPGSVTEKVHCFVGTYGPQDRKGNGGGLDHEGEDIEVVELDFDEALAMTTDGRIMDAKTVALIQFAALNRPRFV